jgi:glycosyltransferase involved in cell wall biosynthesis
MLPFLSILTLFLLTSVALFFAGQRGKLRYLRDISPDTKIGSVSIIVAARNEDRKIEKAMKTLLQQQDLCFEIIAVNDRSTDDTGEILDRLAFSSPRLRVIHITNLPKGWVGKNHALYCAALSARTDYLLFTDADVFFTPKAIAKAITLARTEGFDHVAVAPQTKMPGLLLTAFIVTFSILFGIRYRPWNASNPKSRAYIGIGAFNLVKTSAYQAIGGHSKISMSPIDDLDLGRLLKDAGYRQTLVGGNGNVTVEWYSGLKELVEGLMKNSFSVVNYNLLAALLTGLVLASVSLGPMIGLIFGSQSVFWFSAGSVLCILFIFTGTALTQNLPPASIVFLPAAIVLIIYIFWRAALLATLNSGITWRGTFYSLEEIKAQRVVSFK